MAILNGHFGEFLMAKVGKIHGQTVHFYLAIYTGALGQAMLLVVVNVLMLVRTHSAPAVALLWVVPQVATLASGTLVGRWTDRWDKRRTLWISNALGTVLVLGLLIAPNVWAIYAVFGLFAVVDNVFRAAFNPYFRLLVPESRRMRANAGECG